MINLQAFSSLPARRPHPRSVEGEERLDIVQTPEEALCVCEVSRPFRRTCARNSFYEGLDKFYGFYSENSHMPFLQTPVLFQAVLPAIEKTNQAHRT